jgi:hypothetical protein
VSDVLFARRGWGGVVPVGFYVGVGCVLVGETSHPPFSPASSSMLRWPSVLSSVDFWPVTSPLRRPTAVPCLIHWMIVGVSFVQGKEEVGVCFLVRWECFVETWSSS